MTIVNGVIVSDKNANLKPTRPIVASSHRVIQDVDLKVDRKESVLPQAAKRLGVALPSAPVKRVSRPKGQCP